MNIIKNELKFSETHMLPDVGIRGNYTNMSRQYEDGSDLERTDQYNSEIFMKFNFLPWTDGSRGKRYEYMASQAKMEQKISEEIFVGISKYLEICCLEKKRESLVKELTEFKKELKILITEIKKGLYTDFEKTDLISDLSLKKMEILDLENCMKNLKYDLFVLSGYVPNSFEEVELSLENDFLEKFLNKTVITRKPEIKKLFFLIKQLEAKKQNSVNMMPEINLELSAGVEARNLFKGIKSENFFTKLQIGFNHTLFDGGKSKIKGEIAASEKEEVKAQYEELCRRTAANVKKLLGNREILEEQKKTVKKIIEKEKLKLKILRAGFSRGSVSFQTLKKTRNFIMKNERKLLDLKENLYLNLIDIFRGYPIEFLQKA